MKIFSLETKKYLVGWSLVLGFAITVLTSFFLFITTHCVDTCAIDVGWPVVFGTISTQLVDDHSQEKLSNPIQFEGASVILNKFSYFLVPIWNIERGWWTRQEYRLFDLLIDFMVFFCSSFTILSLVRHFRKKNFQNTST